MAHICNRVHERTETKMKVYKEIFNNRILNSTIPATQQCETQKKNPTFARTGVVYTADFRWGAKKLQCKPEETSFLRLNNRICLDIIILATTRNTASRCVRPNRSHDQRTNKRTEFSICYNMRQYETI